SVQHSYFTVPDTRELPSIPENVSGTHRPSAQHLTHTHIHTHTKTHTHTHTHTHTRAQNQSESPPSALTVNFSKPVLPALPTKMPELGSKRSGCMPLWKVDVWNSS